MSAGMRALNRRSRLGQPGIGGMNAGMREIVWTFTSAVHGESRGVGEVGWLGSSRVDREVGHVDEGPANRGSPETVGRSARRHGRAVEVAGLAMVRPGIDHDDLVGLVRGDQRLSCSSMMSPSAPLTEFTKTDGVPALPS
jgi:hypothetical protein